MHSQMSQRFIGPIPFLSSLEQNPLLLELLRGKSQDQSDPMTRMDHLIITLECSKEHKVGVGA
jgi:hypothetical protein